jgi:uncharacterized iron-regulated membrane protein
MENMGRILAVAVGLMLGTGAAWAGVAPQQGTNQQAMSGAKIKPPSQQQDEQPSNEPSAEKKDGAKDDKH